MSKENIIGTNFIMTNRDLITKFGVNSAIMLGELYGRMNYFSQTFDYYIFIVVLAGLFSFLFSFIM